jgi:hypothetical protein
MDQDIQVGMAVSDLVGVSATTTAKGLMGAQVLATLKGQGVTASMEGPATMANSFNVSSVPEQHAARALVVGTPALTLTHGRAV